VKTGRPRSEGKKGSEMGEGLGFPQYNFLFFFLW
jgi:hypothetical protein